MSDLSVSSLGLATPAVDPATEPAAVRNGGTKAEQAYETGLAFEQMLVSELTQELQSSTSSDGSDGSGGGDGSDSGLLGNSSDSADMLGQLLPQALTQGITSTGGLGVAAQIAASIDPALRGKLS
jgi:Rod binding domain-containing protein